MCQLSSNLYKWAILYLLYWADYSNFQEESQTAQSFHETLMLTTEGLELLATSFNYIPIMNDEQHFSGKLLGILIV